MWHCFSDLLLCVLIYIPLASFRELGPPDLCHVVKSSGRQVAREVRGDSAQGSVEAYFVLQFGSYHYVSGVDASSSASLAAYINSLTYAIEDASAWFSKAQQFKVKNGCYW